jgi:hypothetical protein
MLASRTFGGNLAEAMAMEIAICAAVKILRKLPGAARLFEK